jgi:hypothetical protein
MPRETQLKLIWLLIDDLIRKTGKSRWTLYRVYSDPDNQCRRIVVRSDPGNQFGRAYFCYPDYLQLLERRAKETYTQKITRAKRKAKETYSKELSRVRQLAEGLK